MIILFECLDQAGTRRRNPQKWRNNWEIVTRRKEIAASSWLSTETGWVVSKRTVPTWKKGKNSDESASQDFFVKTYKIFPNLKKY